MHPFFPYVMGALIAGAFFGLTFALNAALSFRDDVLAWQSGAVASAVAAAEKLQDQIRQLKDEGRARDIALERQADELRQHRLSLPPPAMRASSRRPVQTSEDWDDGDGRATVVRPPQPPPLPAFERPGYMAR